MSLVVIAIFIALFVPLFYDYFTINESIVLSIYTALFVSVAMVFVITARNTLKGFAALMKKEPNEDGTVNDQKMLDGVRGKLNEVVCEAAPQGNLQVRLSYSSDSCCRKYSTLALYNISSLATFSCTSSSNLESTLSLGSSWLELPFH